MDKYDEPVDVRTAVNMLGWTNGTYRTILHEVKHGVNPPPVYTKPGGRRLLVKAREVKEWYDRITRVEQ